MNAQILCIGGSAARSQKWGVDLEADGYVVVHAPDETEAVELLKAAPVAVVCGADSGWQRSAAALLERVDIVIDESTVTKMGQIEELREVRLPLFVE